ncbi:hypothetical protein ACOMHN_058318 [Nucella lapillus]
MNNDDLTVEHIFGTMNNDDLTVVARNDMLIVMYGEKLYQMHRRQKQKNGTRQKVREVARFLLAARQADSSITDLQSCNHPGKFPKVISAVRQIWGYTTSDNSFKNPSLAKKLGPALKRCALVLKSIVLIDGDSVLRERIEDFVS